MNNNQANISAGSSIPEYLPSTESQLLVENKPINDLRLVPGLTLLDGRYRLLATQGENSFLHFWQALDTKLNRQVALTFIAHQVEISEEELNQILIRTQKLSYINHPGIARILNIIRIGSDSGLVVSEWIRGASLKEIANTVPSALGSARASRSIASAAELAHRSGITLGIDHPARVRINNNGDAVLAFPATLPNSKPNTDIRGIGAVLYFLLVNHWPLPLEQSQKTDNSNNEQLIDIPNPTDINPDIPYQIAAASMHAIQPNGGIRSASTLLNLLQQATAIAEHADFITPVEEEEEEISLPTINSEQEASKHAFRKKSILIGAGIGTTILIIALGILLSIINSAFGDGKGLNKQRLGLHGQNTSSSKTNTPHSPDGFVIPSQISVFSPGGEPDRAKDASLAIDNNPATAWSTDTYYDPAPFPSYKPGVGLMLTLANPTKINNVTITITDTIGTRIELRSATIPDPARLEDTKIIAPATLLNPGPNQIHIESNTDVKNLLVWISTLGNTNGENRTQISEITIQKNQ